MHKAEQVVVSGIGMVTLLGCDDNKVWKALIDGENGICRLEGSYENLAKYNVHLGGIARYFSFDELKNIDRQQNAKLKKMSLTVRMLVCSGLKALEDAKLQPGEDTEQYNIGAIIACGSPLSEQYEGIPVEDRNPKWFLETYPNLILSVVNLHNKPAVPLHNKLAG